MEEILLNAEEKMESTINSLDYKFTNVRAGRANPSMLDGITVEYYGSQTPLKQLANISIPEARQLMIKPFDKGILGGIEKAIFEANIGITPNNNGECIFLVIPPLTEERRKELVKQVKSLAEEARIALRNIRQEANNELKKLVGQLNAKKIAYLEYSGVTLHICKDCLEKIYSEINTTYNINSNTNTNSNKNINKVENKIDRMNIEFSDIYI